jgi:hypothetical protein
MYRNRKTWNAAISSQQHSWISPAAFGKWQVALLAIFLLHIELHLPSQETRERHTFNQLETRNADSNSVKQILIWANIFKRQVEI